MGYPPLSLVGLIVLFLGTRSMKITLEELLPFNKSIDRETGTKVCPKCERRLHWSEFAVRKSGRTDYDTGENRPRIDSSCRECIRNLNRQRYRDNPTAKGRWEDGENWRKTKKEKPVAGVDLDEATSFPLQKHWGVVCYL